MSSLTTLPPVLQERLAGLARRVRLARVVHGSSVCALLTVSFFVVLFVADSFLGFSQTGLKILFGGLALVAILAIARLVLVPLLRELRPAALAAMVEENHPELHERLTSSVEPTSGSPALVAALLEETVARAKILDFDETVSLEQPRRLARLARASFLIVLIVAVLWPPLGNFSHQLFSAWFAAPPPPFRMVVEPGDALVPKGREATITVRIFELQAGAPFPETCFLVLPKSDMTQLRVPMKLDPAKFFYQKLETVKEDVDYFIEVGEQQTPVYKLKVVEPIDVAEMMLTVSPPEYANPKVHPVRSLKNPDSAVSVVEFSRVRFDFRFKRPAARGQVLVRNPKETESGTPETCQLDLQWFEENCAACVELPSLSPGEYSLMLNLESDKRIPTMTELPVLRVLPDAPPMFSRLELPKTEVVSEAMKSDSSKAREVPPDDVVPISFTAEDQVGLNSIALEYRVGDSPARTELIVRAEGEMKVTSEFLFHLNGKVQDGDVLLFRLQAVDNRRVKKGQYLNIDKRPVPSQDLAPQETFAPAGDRWFALHIHDNAEPLENPDMLAARLDRAKLAELARREEELAKLAATLDAARKDEIARLRSEQDRLAEELRRLLEKSKLFQKALAAMQAQDAERLSKQAYQLARQQRELSGQAGDNLRQELLKKLAPLAKKQQDLGVRAGKLGEETAAPLKEAGLPRFQNADALKAADGLRAAQVAEALEHQAKTASDLARLGADIENAINLSRSPREAARQLAKKQEEIERKLEKLAQDFGRLTPDQLRKALQELTNATQAIQQAIKKLPAQAKETIQQRNKAAELAGWIAEQIEPDAAAAYERMKEIRQALERLAAQLPAEPKAIKDDATDLARRQQSEAARRLAREQLDLKAAVEKAIREAMAADQIARDSAKQKQLMDAAKQLSKELSELAEKAGASDQAQEKAGDAAASAQQAHESMKRSLDQNKQGEPEQGSQARQQAAQELDQAGLDAALAGQLLSMQKATDPESQTTAELQQGQQAMQQAQNQLKQAQLPGAGKSMQQAAQSMQRAANQAFPQPGINRYIDQKMTKEDQTPPRPDGFPQEASDGKAKAWGDLPGELRTRILQDLRTRHGDDYGAIIQHYFEQIADVPMRKK